MSRRARPVPLTRRTFLHGSGAALGATLLPGCGSRPNNELSFWNFYAPSQQVSPPGTWFTAVVDEWNQHNTTKVRLRYVPPADYFAGRALQTAFSAGEGPDIFLVSPGDFLRYYNGGVLADLTPYLSPKVVADHVEGVLDTRMVDNKIFGLPMEIEPLAMFYSVRAFESAGLSQGDVPRTWDQLLEVGRRLTTKDRFGVLFETTPGYYQNFTWYPFMWMGGASAVPRDGDSGFDAPGAEQALAFWQRAIRDGIAPRKSMGDGGGDAMANLAAGHCAIQQTGIWSVFQLADRAPDFRYGVFPLPVPADGTYTTGLGGWAVVANSKGRDPEAAARFVTWALGSSAPDGVDRCRRWNAAKTNLPARRSVQSAAKEAGAFATGPLATFLEDVVPGGRSEPRYTPEVYQAVSYAIQDCQLNGADPARSVADAAKRIDRFLRTYQGARLL